MDKDLGGRIALITGSGRGIGRAIAMRLAELGAHVAIHDLDRTAPARYGEAGDLEEVAAQIARFGNRVVAVTGNIADPDAVAAMRTTIEAAIGPVDILVNCAGGDIGAAGGKPAPNNALDMPMADIRALIDNNLIGTINVCKTFVVPMRERPSGSVVNLASIAGHFGLSEGAIYAILKAAVTHYTRCLAKELQHSGVRVNTVSPGPTRTARFEATRQVDPAMMKSDQVSLDRYAVPQEIAEAVCFLAGPRAGFINGQTLCVDGGVTLFPV